MQRGGGGRGGRGGGARHGVGGGRGQQQHPGTKQSQITAFCNNPPLGPPAQAGAGTAPVSAAREAGPLARAPPPAPAGTNAAAPGPAAAQQQPAAGAGGSGGTSAAVAAAAVALSPLCLEQYLELHQALTKQQAGLQQRGAVVQKVGKPWHAPLPCLFVDLAMPCMAMQVPHQCT